MITASNIFIKYGDRTLLDKVNFVIGVKDKVGLVGRNGAGKSTLLKVIARYINPHEGQVTYPNDVTIGYLHQEIDLPKGKTVLQEALTAFAEVKALEDKLEKITVELGERTDYESDAYMKLLTQMSDINDQIQVMGGNTLEADTERILKGLGFKQSDFSRLTDEFSGGWQMRVELAKLLLQQPAYLLLDEPTNHLDIESILWLENFLKTYVGSVLVISHDKQFLDNVTKRTIEIEIGKLYDYKASYTNYVEMRKERKGLQEAAFNNQQKVIAQKEKVINKFIAKANKTKMAQSMRKQLSKMERIEVDIADTHTMKLRFPPAPRSGQVVIDAQNVTKSYGKMDVLSRVGIKADRGDRIAFVGQNGQGKTTLAKILINELAATAGDVNLGHNVTVGYYAQNQSDVLQTDITVLQTMENSSPPELRTSLRNILGTFMFSGEDVEKKVSVLSGGERARLALACLLLRPFNLLVLDEPTNHLDMLSKEVLKKALMEYDGTLLVVSHDRDFLISLTSRTIEFRDQKLYEYIGDINAFLEKRALQNMREVEMKTASKAKKSKKGAPQKETEEERKARKQAMRSVQNAERKIEKLEAEIAVYETKMAAPDFYEIPDMQAQLKAFNALKKDLEETMAVWETASETLEKLG